jgi:hypothetical protein
MGILMFEIALTRIFSIMMAYHFVFIAVSGALLGLGLGAGFYHFVRSRALRMGGYSLLCKLSIAFSLSILITTALILKIPYTRFFLIYYPITFVPFFLGGVIFALIFDGFTERSGGLYCASLIGSGVGALSIVFALDLLGGVKASLLIGVISAVAPIPPAISSGRKSLLISSLIAFLVLSSVFAVNLNEGLLSEVKSRSPDKELFIVLNDPKLKARITRTYWSAYARTDLVEMEDMPDRKLIFNDGGAGMEMFRFDGENFDTLRHLRRDPASFPFLFGPKDKILIIGAGGGKDVLIALMNGAREITAVEVNPDIVNIVREESEFNGNIYHRENVRWVTAEGRNFIRRSNERYDLIMLTFVWTNSAREVVGYSLTENYVYTVEALVEYINHLTQNGRLIIVVHNEREVMKLFSTAVAAINRTGKNPSQAMRHIISFAKTKSHPHRFALVLRKSPFSKKESIEMHNAVHLYGFHPVYFPYAHEDPTFKRLIDGQASLPFNANPTTDNSPFFYNYDEKGVPSLLSLMLYGVAFLTLIIAFMAWLSIRSDQERGLSTLEFPLYFLLLGLGFMFVEMAIIQKFILFLGQPTLTFSTLLFSLLIGGGIGSLFSGYMRRNLHRKISFVCLLIAVIIAAYIFVLPFVFNRFLGYTLTFRLIISAMLISPLGFVMGIPFPLGLRALKRSFEGGVPWAWGINGVASVLGSALAIAAAMSFGFTAVLALGTFSYLCVALISYRLAF